jgi:hypothetical protein
VCVCVCVCVCVGVWCPCCGVVIARVSEMEKNTLLPKELKFILA